MKRVKNSLINICLSLSLFALLGLFSACTHSVHQYHVSDGDRELGATRVTASAKQFTILGFTTDTNYVNQAWQKLQSLCPGKRINGINTRYSTSHGFFSWTNEVKMTGHCTK